MKEILKSVSKLSIPTIINLISSVLRNKVIAIVTGPTGLGIYSQFVNLSTLATSILPIGSLGLMSYVAKYYENDMPGDIVAVMKHFFIRNFIIAASFTLILLVFSNQLSFILFANDSLSYLLIIYAFSIPFNLILNFIDIYLRGIRKISKYALFLSVNTIISTSVIIPFVYFLGIYGAIISFLVTAAISLTSSYFLLKKNNLLLDISIKTPKIEKSVLSNVYKLGIGALITMVAQQLTLLAIKSTIATKLGIDSVGEFQCVYSISAGYFGVFFALIASYSIPKVSTLKKDSDIIQELNSTIKFLLLIFTPLIIFMFVSRAYVISILYSNEFIGAKALLTFQLPAEFVRALSWVAGLWLIPAFRIKEWIIFDTIFYALFFLLFYVLLVFFNIGLISASISYLFSYIVLFIMYYLYSIKIIKFKFNNNNIKLLFISLIFLLTSFTVSYFFESMSYYVVIPILASWILIVVKKQDIESIKTILKSKFLKNN